MLSRRQTSGCFDRRIGLQALHLLLDAHINQMYPEDE